MRLATSRNVLAVAVAVAAMFVAAGAGPASTGPGEDLDGDVVVFAAASLTDAFTAIGAAFESENPDIDLAFNFGASSSLVAQIREGAPADVFASADERTMEELVEVEQIVAEPATFATNRLAIVVERGNPLGIAALEDLAEGDLVVVTCDPAVPIGSYTREVFAAAGIDVTPDSYEENVRAILTKVVQGEADAGVVYVTDVLAAGDDAEEVAIPREANVVVSYPIAPVRGARNAAGAAAFIDFVLRETGQRILAEFGFGPIDAAAATTSPDPTLPVTTAA